MIFQNQYCVLLSQRSTSIDIDKHTSWRAVQQKTYVDSLSYIAKADLTPELIEPVPSNISTSIHSAVPNTASVRALTTLMWSKMSTDILSLALLKIIRSGISSFQMWRS